MDINQVSGPVSFLPHILSWRTFATRRREVSCEQLKWSFERPLIHTTFVLFLSNWFRTFEVERAHWQKQIEWRQTWLTVHSTYRTKSRAQLHVSAGKRHESLAERPGKPSRLMADCGGRTSETLYTFSSIHQIGNDFQVAGKAYVESHQKACLGSEKSSEHVFDLSRAVQTPESRHETTSDLR